MKKSHLSTDRHGGFVKQDLGRSPDQDMEKYDHDTLKIIPTFYKLVLDLLDGVRSQSRKQH
jgi:hypothetical protein